MAHTATTSDRAGQYIQQPAEYKAFVPKSLPPTPPIQLSGEQRVLQSKADRALGRLDGVTQTLPDPDLFVYMYVRKEAVLSSQIEGTQSSLHDLVAAEAGVVGGMRRIPKDVDEVSNYVKAMNYGLTQLKKIPISVWLMREIHKVLLRGVRGGRLEPGELRRSQNWIGHEGCSLREASFVPPPPDIVPNALGDLEQFLHQHDSLPALVKIGLAHAQFEIIHPFLDGNGRIGRLLITFLLVENQILQRPVLYLSYFFKRHRQEYYEHLKAVHDYGEWENWLAFFFRGVVEVCDDAVNTSRCILQLQEQHRHAIIRKFGMGAGNGIKILDRMFHRPIVSIHDVMQWTKTTYTTSNNMVKQLVALGILKEITGQTRNRRFSYDPYIRLLSGEETEETSSHDK